LQHAAPVMFVRQRQPIVEAAGKAERRRKKGGDGRIGGGVASASLALALLRRGWRVTLYCADEAPALGGFSGPSRVATRRSSDVRKAAAADRRGGGQS
jgi:hypothetical protein